ncbi:SDR family oxidoreductase [Cohnella panacarvi]|uniref:SDR family oxidoreductase n=1 Tax=Cohnella panacarvi TaxID=400776 RepID=UPI00047C74FC|nr:SDR family oxidoreductase [Cohnella panacarvi]
MNYLITGAGRGLGLELTKAALERGHSVIACIRETADATGGLLKLAAEHERLHIERLNVTHEEEAMRLASKLAKDNVKLHCIINNAGILLARDHSIETLPMHSVRLSFDVNVYGPMIVAKHLSPLLADNEGARLLNISSEAGSMAMAYGGDFPYAMSKATLNMFSIQLKHLLWKRGIRVFAIHPGWIRTDMGGNNAPLSAGESAQGILDIADGTTKIADELVFVDYTGRSMPL